MMTEPLSGSWQTPQDDENARRRQRLMQEFPQGLAPYKSDNLITFGFFGGIIGAGIAGAVSLSRTNHSRAVPSLLLTTLIVLVVYWICLLVILDRVILVGTQSEPRNFPLVAFVLNVGIGILFAAWIARRQRPLSQRWLNLSGTPNWRDQGGCLGAIGWIIVSSIVAYALYTFVFIPLAPSAFRVMYPPQHYTTVSASLSVPAGWIHVEPETIGVNCKIPSVTCLATVEDRWSGSRAVFTIQSGITPYFLVNLYAISLKDRYSFLPDRRAESYSVESLADRQAATLSYEVNQTTWIYTGIANGDQVIGAILICNIEIVSDCAALRDQFISTLEFAPESNAPDLSELVE